MQYPLLMALPDKARQTIGEVTRYKRALMTHGTDAEEDEAQDEDEDGATTAAAAAATKPPKRKRRKTRQTSTQQKARVRTVPVNAKGHDQSILNGDTKSAEAMNGSPNTRHSACQFTAYARALIAYARLKHNNSVASIARVFRTTRYVVNACVSEIQRNVNSAYAVLLRGRNPKSERILKVYSDSRSKPKSLRTKLTAKEQERAELLYNKVDKGDEGFMVKAVVAHFFDVNNKPMYLIEWKHFPPLGCTAEYADDIGGGHLSQYWASYTEERCIGMDFHIGFRSNFPSHADLMKGLATCSSDTETDSDHDIIADEELPARVPTKANTRSRIITAPGPVVAVRSSSASADSSDSSSSSASSSSGDLPRAKVETKPDIVPWYTQHLGLEPHPKLPYLTGVKTHADSATTSESTEPVPLYSCVYHHFICDDGNHGRNGIVGMHRAFQQVSYSWHDGCPVRVTTVSADKKQVRVVVLGKWFDKGHIMHHTIPGQVWRAFEVLEPVDATMITAAFKSPHNFALLSSSLAWWMPSMTRTVETDIATDSNDSIPSRLSKLLHPIR
jgi:predicted cupin superfamily sugar epimerase